MKKTITRTWKENRGIEMYVSDREKARWHEDRGNMHIRVMDQERGSRVVIGFRAK